MAERKNENKSISKSILSSLEGNDLSKLAIPRPIDLHKLFGDSYVDKLQLMAKQMSESLKPHQSILKFLAPQLSEMASLIKKQYQPQMDAFQSAIKQIQPFISNAELLSKQLQVLSIPQGLTSDALMALSSFNSLQRLSEVFEEYDEINPIGSENTEAIREVITQNTEMFIEVRELIASGSQKGLQPGDIPELIYSYLVNKLPYIDTKKYGFIVLLFTAILFTYERYSDYQQGEKIEEIIDRQVETNKRVTKIDNQTEDTKNRVNEIGEDIDSLVSQFNKQESKLDLIIDEMHKKKHVKKRQSNIN